MENEMPQWTGWKEISIPSELVGDSITKGDGYYKKEYRYIKMPLGYGYDGYVFLISEKLLVQFDYLDQMHYYVKICDDMTFELFYDPKLREDKKRYKRWKLTVHELFDRIIEQYKDGIFQKEYAMQQEKKAQKEKRDKSIIGTIVCGRYTGNLYGNIYEEYRYQDYLTSFFKCDAGTYSNQKFSKVQNVNLEFVIIKNISKYHFLLHEELINAFINEYETYANIKDILEHQLMHSKNHNTGTEDILEKQLENCIQAMEEVKKRLISRITELVEKK